MTGILDEIERLLSAILGSASEKRSSSSSKIGPLDISSNISVKVGLDELGQDPAARRPALDAEPLIDAIEKGEELKIVVFMPGIREEDAIVRIADGRLVVEVRRGLTVYRKEFPCSIGPELVVTQTSLSNSVLEMVCKAKEVGE